MSSFIICLRQIFVSVKCAPIKYFLRLLLALRGIICIPWGFWFCLLLFMKVVSKHELIFCISSLFAQDHSLGFTSLFRVLCGASTSIDTDCYSLILQTLWVTREKTWIPCMGRWWPCAAWLLLSCLQCNLGWYCFVFLKCLCAGNPWHVCPGWHLGS